MLGFFNVSSSACVLVRWIADILRGLQREVRRLGDHFRRAHREFSEGSGEEKVVHGVGPKVRATARRATHNMPAAAWVGALMSLRDKLEADWIFDLDRQREKQGLTVESVQRTTADPADVGIDEWTLVDLPRRRSRRCARPRFACTTA